MLENWQFYQFDQVKAIHVYETNTISCSHL